MPLRKLTLGSVALACLASTLAVALGQDERRPAPPRGTKPVSSVDLTLGCDPVLSYVRPGAFFPARVRISNEGGKATAGEAVLSEFQSGGRVTRIRTPFTLLKGGRIVLPLDVCFARSEGPINREMSLVTPLGESLATRCEVADSRLVLVVEAERTRANRMHGRRLSDRRTLAAVEPDWLPESGRALESFDAVLVPANLLAGLSPSRRDALFEYANDGGSLVVTTETSGVGVREVEAELPASVDASSPALRPVGLSFLLATCGDTGMAGVMEVARLRPKPGARVVVRGDAGEPLLVERRAGLGRVLLAAFRWSDPAIDRLDAWDELGRLLAPPPATEIVVARPRHDDPLVALPHALAVGVAVPTPAPREVVSVLVIYFFVLFPGLVLAARALRRPELFWVALPLVSVAFSAFMGARADALYGKNTATVQGCIVELGSGARGGPSRRLVGILSPARHRYEIELPSGEWPLFAPGSQARELSIAVTPVATTVEGFEVLLGEVGFLETRGRLDLGGPVSFELEVGLSDDLPARAVIHVANGSSRDMDEAFLFRQGLGYAALPRLAKGATFEGEVAFTAAAPTDGPLSTIASQVRAAETLLFARLGGASDSLGLDGRRVTPAGPTVVVVHPEPRLPHGLAKLGPGTVEIRPLPRGEDGSMPPAAAVRALVPLGEGAKVRIVSDPSRAQGTWADGRRRRRSRPGDPQVRATTRTGTDEGPWRNGFSLSLTERSPDVALLEFEGGVPPALQDNWGREIDWTGTLEVTVENP